MMDINLDSKKIVLTLLELRKNSDELTLANISEIVLFACKVNPVLRFVLTPKFKNTIEKKISSMGLHHKSGNLYVKTGQNGWNSISNKSFNVKNQVIQSLFVMGYKSDDVDNCFNSEMNGDYAESAKYFNYPKCCIDGYFDFQNSNNKWAKTLIDKSGKAPYSCWNNRLATGWGGGCFVGELFPCNLKCKKSIEIGKKTYKCLNDLGLKKLADKFLEHSMHPLAIDSDGLVKKIVDNNVYNNIIRFIK